MSKNLDNIVALALLCAIFMTALNIYQKISDIRKEDAIFSEK
jgi:hypothetical protein